MIIINLSGEKALIQDKQLQFHKKKKKKRQQNSNSIYIKNINSLLGKEQLW